MKGMTIVVKTVTRLTVPFIILFGFYVFLHGHISHGVGFAGGVIVTLALVQYMLAFGKSPVTKKLDRFRTLVVLNTALALFVIAAAVAVLYDGHLTGGFAPLGAFVSRSRPAVILALNAAFCLVTASALYLVFVSVITFKSRAQRDGGEE